MQGMRELLRSSLGKSLSALEPADKLAAAWPVACGRSMAEHGIVTGYADGCVTIEVSDSTWLDQMLAMRAQLTAELRRIASVELREIHFHRSGAARPGSKAGPWVSPKPRPASLKGSARPNRSKT